MIFILRALSVAGFVDSSNYDWLQESVEDRFDLWMTALDTLNTLRAEQSANELINLALNEWKLGCGGGVACNLKSPRLRGSIVFLSQHRPSKIASASTYFQERLRRLFDAVLDVITGTAGRIRSSRGWGSQNWAVA